MSSLAAWMDRHTAAAPAALRDRVREYALEAERISPVFVADRTGPAHAHVLASAGAAALARVTAHAGDRSVALDLLAADALITLALLEQAERDPSRLGELAADLLHRHGPATS